MSPQQAAKVAAKEVVQLGRRAGREVFPGEIGGLPVMRGGSLVGIITETDLFKILLELLGGRRPGIRVAVAVPSIKGELSKITTAIFQADLGPSARSSVSSTCDSRAPSFSHATVATTRPPTVWTWRNADSDTGRVY